MKIVDGKIVEATRDELIDYFMRHIDAGDSLGVFILRCKDDGIKIIKEGARSEHEQTTQHEGSYGADEMHSRRGKH